MADKRSGRKRAIQLKNGFVPVPISKSMFLDDLFFTIPSYYAEQWDGKVRRKKFSGQNISFTYVRPRGSKGLKSALTFDVSLSYFLSSKRPNRASCYRISWSTDFAKQLAEDYPVSFSAALEYKFGNRYYDERGFSPADVGVNEQLQLCVEISEDGNSVKIEMRELFREKEEKQQFPFLSKTFGRYAIAEYLLRESEGKVSRVAAQGWKERGQLDGEVVQNVVYLLANPETGKVYVGETVKSLGGRYSLTEPNHALSDWSHFNVIPLPSGTGSDERKLIQNCVIQMMAGILKAPPRLNVERLDSSQDTWTLVNRSVV